MREHWRLVELSRYKVLGGLSQSNLWRGTVCIGVRRRGQTFTRYPFTVVELKNDDPYTPAGTLYFIEGAWNEYGNIYYQRNDPQSAISFTTWLQDKRGNQNPILVPYELKLVNVKTGKVLGEETGSFRMEPHWLKAQLNFHPAGDKNSYLKGADLLREDGRYSVRLAIDGKPYGDYPFTVEGGKIQLQGRQVRQNTDGLDYIVDYLSGGRYTSWWLKRDKAGR